MNEIKIKLLHDRATLPEYSTTGAACFDLRAIYEVEVPANKSAIIDTGLMFELPEGHMLLLYSRSGHGFKHGLRLSNSVGVVDQDYRGEVKLSLHNDGALPYTVIAGERICQGMIMPVAQFTFVSTQDVNASARGAGGFGSTGT